MAENPAVVEDAFQVVNLTDNLVSLCKRAKLDLPLCQRRGNLSDRSFFLLWVQVR